jgi:hypothetical protein
VEKVAGREAAVEAVYGAWWFVALWGVFAVAAVTYIIRVALYRNKPALLLHTALCTILLGALLTFVTAERGYLHIRQGETARTYTPEAGDTDRPLPFEVKLVLFDIEYHAGTREPADYISFLKVDGEITRVSMNRIFARHGYRLYQMDYDPDEMGTVLSVNHDPWGIGVTYAGYLLLAVAMLWLLWRRIGRKGLLYMAIPVAGLWFYISQLNPMTPVLRSPMLAAHVSVIMAAYALFVFITVTAVIGLCVRRRSERFYRWNITRFTRLFSCWRRAYSSARCGPTSPGVATGAGTPKRRGRSSRCWCMRYRCTGNVEALHATPLHCCVRRPNFTGIAWRLSPP